MNMDHKYYPHTMRQKLGYLIEEAGEVLAAAGKSLRWGLESVNPELPPEQQETNRNWLRRELKDLRQAIDIVESALNMIHPPNPITDIPPLDPLTAVVQNMKLKTLLDEHIYELPKPAQELWRQRLNEIYKDQSDDPA